eukprot:CAMPEP_0168627658 /NCGR_PEP_ID=MMETSP0449_2-20121227/11387_1 /TAXON_ID=1082188 /ORGANISM="Strombidium rassoulzadegani, Strain ras09" /LENGTH=44 /DNA_ID= /DNA_START= /DNA_END= /DNA_ORIENTATION=
MASALRSAMRVLGVRAEIVSYQSFQLSAEDHKNRAEANVQNPYF